MKHTRGQMLSKLRHTFVLNPSLSIAPNTSPLDTDIIHDAPPELSELVDRIWNQPFDRIPTHGRWGLILLAVREVQLLFMYTGIHVAFPGYEVQRNSQSTQIVQDAYA
eukprot:4601944-Pyramimonas_sp.AAC.1